jgi:hypothetical protein
LSASFDYPPHLACMGRDKQPISAFSETDLLFIGYRLANIDSNDGQLITASIRLPDWSCNWSRYSHPEDVRFRENGLATDGCLSIDIKDVRYQSYATAVHDPICDSLLENYSHCEVRTVQEGGSVESEPPRNGSKRGKQARLAWRRHIRNRLKIEILATA